ncbi:MAG: hypothetical protein KDA36_11535, partial [Planctomycetaceae bacterium]|nr:hypothetical protein [Planctomycetaceae bacterium]
MLLSISDTPANERGPRHTKAILSPIHQAIGRRFPVTFSYGAHAGSVGLYLKFPDRLTSLIKGQFYAKYPDCRIEQLAETALDPPIDHVTWGLDLRLQPDIFPLIRYQQYEDAVQTEIDDPIGGLLQVLAPDNTPVQTRIDLTVLTAGRSRRHVAQQAIESLSTRSFFRTYRRLANWYARGITSPSAFVRYLAWIGEGTLARGRLERTVSDELDKSSSRLHDSERDLQAAAVKLGHHLFEARLRITASAPPQCAALARQRLEEIAAVLNKFTIPRLATWNTSPIRQFSKRDREPKRGFLLSDEELATLWHLPTKGVRDAQRQLTVWRRLEPPRELPLTEREPNLCELGRVAFQDRSERFGILTEDRFRHLFLVGKTGNGKSTVMLNT